MNIPDVTENRKKPLTPIVASLRGSLKRSVHDKTVLIDSNIVIYLTERTPPFHDISQALFSLVEEGDCRAVISILTVAEVMQGPLRAGRVDIAMAVKNYLVNFPNCDCQLITTDVLEHVIS